MPEEVLKPAKSVSATRFFDFGPYRVDVAKRVLLRGGEPVPLPPKAFETLLRLLQENGQVVTKAELMAAVWPDTFVEENNLNQCVSVLRRTFEDSAEAVARVETIPRRGYRFVGPVVARGSAAVIPALRHRRRLVVVAVVVAGLGVAVLLRSRSPAPAPAPIRSLAVLPFENLSGDAQQDYFADGFTETLTTNLARLQSLRVVSRMSAKRYQGSRQTVPAIARELGVDAVIGGAVLREGDRVRVTAQLVRGDSDTHVWAESYDRETKDVLALQYEVARQVAREVQGKLTPQEDAVFATARPVDPEAYDLHLRGRYLWNKRTRETVLKAAEYFQRAIDRDPGYAAAYSGLADCYSSSGFSHDLASLAPREAFTKARAATTKALEIDGRIADAHNSLGFIKLAYDRDFPGAEAQFTHALRLDPRLASAHHWYAHYLLAVGRRDEALAESRRALELDPLNPILNTHLGWHHVMAGDHAAALTQLRKALDLDPDYGLAHWYLGLAHEQQNAYPQAIASLERADELLGRHVAVEADLAHAHALAGDAPRARRILGDLQARSRRSYVSAFEIALVHFGLRRNDEGFDWLERAYDERADLLVYLNVDPRLAPVRDDPRYRDLVRRVGLP